MKMGKKTQKKVKEVRCNKCGKYFTSKQVDISRIKCPLCGSNESLSIREKSIPKPIREYLEELKEK